MSYVSLFYFDCYYYVVEMEDEDVDLIGSGGNNIVILPYLYNVY